MIKLFQFALLATVVSGPMALLANGQALPTVTRTGGYFGFQIPEASGTLQYSLTASDSVIFGYNGTNTTSNSANFSGNLAFISSSQKYPSTVLYTGAYLVNTSGQPNTFVQTLAVSQTAHLERWTLSVSDAVSYLPAAPNSGLSGVAGLGDQGVTPPVGSPNNFNGILSNYSPRVTNTVSGSVVRSLTGKTSITATGAYTILRFLDDNSAQGLDTDVETATVQLNHRLDARDNIAAVYEYTKNTYPGSSIAFDTQAALLQFSRNLSRKTSISVGGGPQRSSSTGAVTYFPATTSVTANASLAYQGKTYTLSLNYSRGANSGLGVVTGAHTDTITAAASRRLARSLQGSAGVSYGRSNSLAVATDGSPSFTAQSVTGFAQVSYRISRDFSSYASYTASHQLGSGYGNSAISFNGLQQTFAVGITYSPPGHHFGR